MSTSGCTGVKYPRELRFTERPCRSIGRRNRRPTEYSKVTLLRPERRAAVAVAFLNTGAVPRSHTTRSTTAGPVRVRRTRPKAIDLTLCYRICVNGTEHVWNRISSNSHTTNDSSTRVSIPASLVARIETAQSTVLAESDSDGGRFPSTTSSTARRLERRVLAPSGSGRIETPVATPVHRSQRQTATAGRPRARF